MKGLRYGLKILVVVLVMSGCKKGLETTPDVKDPVVNAAVSYLQTELKPADFAALDLPASRLFQDAGSKLSMVRIPVKGNRNRSVTVLKTASGFSSSWLEIEVPDARAVHNTLRVRPTNSVHTSEFEIGGKQVVRMSIPGSSGQQEMTIDYADGLPQIRKATQQVFKFENPEEMPPTFQWLPEFVVTATIGSQVRILYHEA